jgi:hypothetical protein
VGVLKTEARRHLLGASGRDIGHRYPAHSLDGSNRGQVVPGGDSPHSDDADPNRFH